MKKISVSLVLILCSIITGCELEKEVKNPNLLYEPKLVVRAFLYPNQTLSGIVISMTQHPLEPLNDIQKTLIMDANVVITHNGKSYNCFYNHYSYSYECSDLYLQEGETYHLTAKYKNMTATATTIIPSFDIDSVYYTLDSNNYYRSIRAKLYVKVSSNRPFSCYSYDIYEDMYDLYGLETMVRYSPQISSSSNILLDFQSGHNLNYTMSWINNWKGNLVVCDEQMYNYYITKSDYDDWNLFGSGGTNPLWNIKGDGIGLFIGCNYKEIRY